MEARKIHRLAEKMNSLLGSRDLKWKRIGEDKLKKVREAIKEFQKEDSKRIETLPKINIVKWEN